MDKKRIAIVCGGDSSEYAVSLRSAQGIWSFLRPEKYDRHIIVIRGTDWYRIGYDGEKYNTEERQEVNRQDFSVVVNGEKLNFDFCYITIHGTPGENGVLQGYFDMIKMPYNCCGVLAAALTCSKFTCNRYLSTFGIPVAKSILLNKNEDIDTDACIKQLGLPVFVKPNSGGSSYATTKVKNPEELQPAIEAAKNEATGAVIIESFMQGTEITSPCYRGKDGSLKVLPLTEVVTTQEFFDVDAKYNGKVEEITPARLNDEITEKVHELTRQIYGYVGAKGIIRVDFIIIGNEPHLLEVNTTPGMTATSFIPQEVRAAGLDIRDVMDEIINI